MVCVSVAVGWGGGGGGGVVGGFPESVFSCFYKYLSKTLVLLSSRTTWQALVSQQGLLSVTSPDKESQVSKLHAVRASFSLNGPLKPAEKYG